MKKVLSIAIVTAVTACGAFDTKKNGEKAKENDQGLTGSWKNACAKGDWLGLTHETEELKFSAVGDYERKSVLFKDDACAAALVTLNEQGTYASLGTSKSAPNATDVNFTVNSASVQPETEDAAKLLNDASYCGVTTWAKGQAVDVTGKSCLGKSHAKGDVSFDVYRLDQDNKRLTLGKGSLFLDKSDAGSRPEKLDDARAFVRQ